MPPPPANSPFRDPDFGSRMVRVTNANTMAPFGNGYFNNASFMTEASAEANVWGKFDPTLGTNGGYRFVVTGQGGVEVPLILDAKTMNVTKITGNPGSFLNLYGRLDLTGPSFSYTNPDVLFGAIPTSTQLVSYDFSTDRETLVYDFADCPNLPAYVSQPMYVGAVSNSNDNTKFSYYFGGTTQDDTRLAVYYNRSANNGAGACYWYDSQTGMTGGTNMAPTPVVGGNFGPLPSSSAGGFTIHEVRINRDGSYVRIWPAAISRAPILFWKPGTTQVTTCLLYPYGADECGGHLALGFSHLINDPNNGDMAEVLIRPFSNFGTYTELVTPFPTPLQFDEGSHWSWNDDNPTDTMPVCGSFFNAGNPGDGILSILINPLLEITGVYDREIVCVATTGPSKVWRFAHNRASTALNANAGSVSNFWATPRGNVSQDGKFYMFTSDWEWSLGNEQGSQGCPTEGQCRTDVFIVELH